ncbi:MAG: ATP-binding protein [Actinomycetota bacterium]
MALSIPLLLSLRARARAEIETSTLVNAQTIAASFDRTTLKPGKTLNQLVARFSHQIEGSRVIAMNEAGVVLADSERQAVGQNFDTALRPEIGIALDRRNPQANSQIRFSNTLNSDIMVAAAPIVDDGVIGAVRITRSMAEVNAAVRSTTINLILVIGGAGLLVGLAIAFAMAGSLARPLARLASAARRLGSGDLTARAGPLEGADEIRDLAHSFDEMADRVERTVQAQREFVANASHQLRTPLTGMKLRLESAHDQAPTPELKQQLAAADQEVDRLAATVDRLLLMSRRLEEGEPTTVDLHDAASRAIERWRERAVTHSSTLRLLGGPSPARANPTDVDQIFDNLFENALTYAPGAIEVEMGLAEGRASAAVRDHGPGIPDEERGKVTERFYRGKAAPPGGSGLGLAIARDLAERWDGSLAVQQADGGGTRIVLSLPAESETSPNGRHA